MTASTEGPGGGPCRHFAEVGCCQRQLDLALAHRHHTVHRLANDARCARERTASDESLGKTRIGHASREIVF